VMEQPRFLAGDFDTNFINEEYRPEALTRGEDPVRLAALLAAAVTAHRSQNHTATTPGTTAAGANAGHVSAWKTAGRIEMLRR